LARESATDEIDRGEVVSANVSHVSIPGNVGPVLRKDSARVLVVFNLPKHLHSGPFQTEFQTTDTSE